MKKFGFLCALIALLFCGYWWMMRQGLERAVVTAQAEAAVNGGAFTIESARYHGFPLAVRATLEAPKFSGPSGAVAAQRVSLSAQSWQPLKWTVQSQGDLRVDMKTRGGQRYLFDVIPSLMRAQISSGLDGRPRAMTLTGMKLTATPVIGDGPPIRAVDQLIITAAPTDAGTAFTLGAKDVFLDPNAARDLQRAFGPRIDTADITANLNGLRALDSDGLEAWKKAGALRVADSDIIWGDGRFETLADIEVVNAKATGTATLKLRDADALLSALIDADIISGNGIFAAQFALMAAPRDEAGRVMLSLPIENGKVTLFGQTIYEF